MRSNFEVESSSYIQTLIEKQYPQSFWGYCQKAKNFASDLHKENISLAISEAHLISFLVQSYRCRNFVELGTLGGHSALWISWAMGSGGVLHTIEKDFACATFSSSLLKDFADEFARHIQVYNGEAMEILPQIKGPIDGIFIDANKSGYPAYLEWASLNLIKGGLLVADNCLHQGRVYSGRVEQKYIQSIQEFNEALLNSKAFRAAIIPTFEGLAVAEKII